MFGCKKSTMIIRDANRKCKISFKVLQCLRLPALFCLGNILLSTSAVSVFPSCRHFRFFVSAVLFPRRCFRTGHGHFCCHLMVVALGIDSLFSASQKDMKEVFRFVE